MSNNWNPLYPFDEDVDSLEEAAREAEWEDDIRNFDRKHRKQTTDEDDESEDLFL